MIAALLALKSTPSEQRGDLRNRLSCQVFLHFFENIFRGAKMPPASGSGRECLNFSIPNTKVIMSTPESLLPFYVYVLADPNDNQAVFYVGMGSNGRALHHWDEVQRIIRKQLTPTHPKHQLMMEIAATNQKPKQIVIGRFETRDEAYAVEATLINWVYGYNKLTNQNRGHNADQIRAIDQWGELPGIDVEQRVGDGGAMTVLSLTEQREQWVQEEGESGQLGLDIFDYINDCSSRRYTSQLALRRLKFSSRSVATRITFFLDDETNPARPERRLLPNPIARIRMDGSTNRRQLHIQFTKSDEAEATAIFSNAGLDISQFGITLLQPPNRRRLYDMLTPVNSDMDFELLKIVINAALDEAVRNCLEPAP